MIANRTTSPHGDLFDKLTIGERYQGKERVLIRPGISVFFYCDVRTPQMGPSIADAVTSYLAFIKPVSPRMYLSTNGLHKEFSNRQLAKDLNLLRKMPAEYEDFRLRYTESVTGDAGTHELYYVSYLDSHNKDDVLPQKVNLLRMEFPYTILDQIALEEFIAFVITIAETVPFQSGNAGYAFQRDITHERDAGHAVARLLMRYQGFDPSYEDACLEMRNHTFSAHWINLLNSKMVAKLGGVAALRVALPTSDVREFKSGVLIRGARLPPIGDVNRRALDIGCLPDVARLLRPTRVRLQGLGLPSEVFDAMGWLARFDAMPSQKWEQR